jgi:hypothetical protein
MRGNRPNPSAIRAWWGIGALVLGMLALTAGTIIGGSVPMQAGALPPGQGAAPAACGAWSLATSPSPSNASQRYGVKAIAAADVWSVGVYKDSTDNVNKTLTEHWNGTNWTTVASPNAETAYPGYNQLTSVDGLAADDVWAVGRTTHGALTEHWDGTQWTIIPVPDDLTIGYLLGVKMVSHNDVWAVGYAPVGGYPNRGRIIHWNGVTWNAVYVSSDLDRSTTISNLAAVSANNIWAAGSIMMHYDGTAWTEVPNVVPLTGVLNGITAITANDIWAVGWNTPGTYAQTYTTHYDGATWTAQPSPNAETESVLNAVSAASGEVLAVGYSDPGSSYGHTLAMRWTGSAWSIVSSASQDENSELDAVSVLPAGEAWAVGSSYIHGGAQHTVVESYTAGSCGTPTPTPPPCTISFSDVHTSDYFYTPVQYLACHSVIAGYADGTFRPFNNTTRGQLAKIVEGGFNLPITTPPAGGQTFEDVAPSSTFFSYIETLAARGITSGYTCGGANEPCIPPANRPYFRPGNNVTRAQLVKFVVVAGNQQFGWPLLNPATASFSDVPVGSPFYQYVETAVCRGVLSGYSDGTFRPANPATRGQIAKIVYNAVTGTSTGCTGP